MLQDIRTQGKALAGGQQYLGVEDVLDPRLLVYMPFSFVRYISAIFVKSGNGFRLATASWFLFLGVFGFLVDDQAVATIPEFLGALALTGLQVILLARLFLVILLGDRNEVVARNIEDALATADNSGDSTVVAILGMAHCNGVKRLLE